MSTPSVLAHLLTEYDRSLAYTDSLWRDLTVAEVNWRPHPESSAIGWHLGHQAAVAHFMVRNLTAAEASIDPALDALMDSATAERDRGDLPDLDRLSSFRDRVAQRVHLRVGAIASGNVGAPVQLCAIAETMLVAIINHEYQHDKWIGEVRTDQHAKPLPIPPTSELLTQLDGYLVVRSPTGS